MYERAFGLRQRPFGVTPDPRTFYENGVYAEAEAVLGYGVRERKGFVLLTGEAGTGKTTLLRRLMESLPDTAFVFVFNTSLCFDEILAFTCDELGLVPKDGGRLSRIQALNEFLLRQIHAGKTTALLIDEAQNLKDETLEELRQLSNLETSGEKLLQIVLTGQPEIEARLAAPHLRQLAQRIAIRCRLERLKAGEVGAYVRLRLRAAEGNREDLFLPEAIARVSIYSKGIPRLVNVLCDNALLIAFATSRTAVDAETVNEAADDLRLRDGVPPPDSGFPGLEGALRTAERNVRAADVGSSPRSRDLLWAAVLFAALTATGLVLWAHRGDSRWPQWMTELAAELRSRAGLAAAANATLPATAFALSADPGPGTAAQGRAAPTPIAAESAGVRPPRAVETRPHGEPLPRPQVVSTAGEPPRTWIEHKVRRGATAYEIAGAAYGSWCQLGLDLVAEMNPEITNLDELRPGQTLRLPAFSSRTLIRHSRDASQVILGSFASAAKARRFAADIARRLHHEVRVRERRPSARVVLHRVEVITPAATAAAVWETAAGLRLLPPLIEAFSSDFGEPGARRCSPAAVASLG